MNRVRVESLVKVADDVFLPISEVERYDGDRDYLRGAIRLVVDEVPVLSEQLWDDVNWLWPFIVHALDECRRTGSGSTYFPDQAIAFQATRASRPGHVALTIAGSTRHDLTAIAPRDELYEKVAHAGFEFFRESARLGLDPNSAREERMLQSWLDSPGA